MQAFRPSICPLLRERPHQLASLSGHEALDCLCPPTENARKKNCHIDKPATTSFFTPHFRGPKLHVAAYSERSPSMPNALPLYSSFIRPLSPEARSQLQQYREDTCMHACMLCLSQRFRPKLLCMVRTKAKMSEGGSQCYRDETIRRYFIELYINPKSKTPRCQIPGLS
jgi:hypothetical protein